MGDQAFKEFYQLYIAIISIGLIAYGYNTHDASVAIGGIIGLIGAILVNKIILSIYFLLTILYLLQIGLIIVVVCLFDSELCLKDYRMEYQALALFVNLYVTFKLIRLSN